MRPYLLEEVYEVLDAIDKKEEDSERNRAICEELGDLLFVVLLLCQIGADEDRFGFDDITNQITDKMIVRHPHVFGTPEQRQGPGGDIASWEQQKAKIDKKKKVRRSRLDGVPSTLPSLLRAFRQGEKVAAVGFDWSSHTGVMAKIQEELSELESAIESTSQVDIASEYGDVLLSVANLGRHINVTPEEALREANNRFAKRFKDLESLANARGISLDETPPMEVLDELWETVKASEKQ